jgi:hypothetical protein
MAIEGNGGLWVVVKGEKQWDAWRGWLAREFGATFFSDRMTVAAEWPPSTAEGARIVAIKINEARERARLPRGPEQPMPYRGL